MRTDPDRLLNRLVVAALSVFIALVILLAALVVRQVWLQQRLVDASSDLQVNLIELEETTEEIQTQLDEIRATAENDPESENWEGITELLDDVDEQLDSLERDIDDVATVAEEQPTDELLIAVDTEEDSVETASQDSVDQLFTIFAALVGVASIAIAILLWMAVRIQRLAPTGTQESRDIRLRNLQIL